MKFNRMVVNNPEAFSGSNANLPLVYIVTKGLPEDDPMQPRTFYVKGISLQGNGWVFVLSHEDDIPIQCFPPNRVIALEGVLGADTSGAFRAVKEDVF